MVISARPRRSRNHWAMVDARRSAPHAGGRPARLRRTASAALARELLGMDAVVLAALLLQSAGSLYRTADSGTPGSASCRAPSRGSGPRRSLLPHDRSKRLRRARHRRYLASDIGRRWFRRHETRDFGEHELPVDQPLDRRRLIGTGRDVGDAERDAAFTSVSVIALPSTRATMRSSSC